MDTKPSRRALISAVAVAPIVIAAPAVATTIASPSSSLFAQRLAAFHEAYERHWAAGDMPSYTDDLGSKLCQAAADAYEALIDTPAADFAGVSAKLDALTKWSKDSEIPENEVLTIAADAQRLLKREG